MEDIKKAKSRDAARQRRGQQNDEFSELAATLPLPNEIAEKLDRLCVMRLSTSYIKNKHVLQQIKDMAPRSLRRPNNYDMAFNQCIQEALGGFIFVLAEDGQCLYISNNVNENLGLQQLDITGHSIYKYIHPCDQDNLAKQLGGQVPLEDMEIFDGMFCSDPSQFVRNPKPAVSMDFMNSPHRSFFLRMKSTLTSRGKSVNINASIYRVVHCSGTMQMYRTKFGVSDSSMTRCMIGIGMPLMSQSTFEVPADRQTFITKHSLDFMLSDIEPIASSLLGYKPEAMVGTSWYMYSHICDAHVLKTMHNSLLQIGQAVSGYYRIMLKNGGWIWMQTKANVVYVATTGQPQHIMCVHYVISGLELEDQILCVEQLLVPGVQSYGKRSMSETYSPYYEDNVGCKFKGKIEEVIQPSVKIKQESESPRPINTPVPVSPSEAPLKLRKVDNDDDEDDDFDDLPGLEFLDVTDGFAEECFTSRSPFIPPPFNDAKITSPCSSSDGSYIDDNEMINRAPYIPPPCIDKIISFEDLTLPDDMHETFDSDHGFHQSHPTKYHPQTAPLQQPLGELHDFGNARIPFHLIQNQLHVKRKAC